MKRPHEVLKELPEQDLKTLARSGYCPPTVFRNLEIYYYVDARLKTGIKKTAAVLDAEVNFKLCRKSIFSILKSLQ